MLASSAMAGATSQRKKEKKKKMEDVKMRNSNDLREYVENDKSHAFHFWEAVSSSLTSESLKYRTVHHTDVHNDIDDMNIKNNAEEVRDKWLIDPADDNKAVWDTFIAVLVLYTLVALPYRICFVIEDSAELKAVDYAIDAFFVLDIILNFNTTYDATPDDDSDNILELDRWLVAKNYLKSWFLADLAATIPWDLAISLFQNSDPSTGDISLRLIRVIRLLKLLKFLRVIKVKKLLELLESISISPAVVSVFTLVLQILFMAHIICCVWHYIAIPEGGADETVNWIKQLEHDGKSKGELYVISYYWVIATMTSVGYGDIHAFSTNEQLYSCFVILVGSIMFGSIITKVTKIIINRNPQASNLKHKMDDLKGYLNEKHLPSVIKEAALDAYSYYMHKKSLIGESGIFDEMPKPLLVKLVQSIYQEEIQTIGVFKKYEDTFVVQIVINSMPFQVKTGEIIMDMGDVSADILFLMMGKIQISTTYLETTNMRKRQLQPLPTQQELESMKESPPSTSRSEKPNLSSKGRFGRDKRSSLHNEAVAGYCNTGNFIGDSEFLKCSTSFALYRAVDHCNVLAVSNLFISNILTSHIKSALQFTTELEQRYENFQTVLASPVVDKLQQEGVHKYRSRLYVDGEIDDTHIRLMQEDDDDSSIDSLPDINLIRVSRLSENRRVFVEEDPRDLYKRYIFLHNGRYKKLWDVLVGVFIVYSVIAIPVQIGFSISTAPFHDPEAPPLAIFEFMIDCVFMLDILFSFRTSYFDELNDCVETVPHEIRNHYIRTWFFIDLVSTLPFDIIVPLFMGGDSSSLSSIRIIKFVRLSRILKMFRLTKLTKFLTKLEDVLGISPAFFELLKYLIIVILVTHLVCCLWYYACGSISNSAWFDQPVYHLYETDSTILSQNGTYAEQYIATLYFTYSTLSTVGFGDLTPYNYEEKLFAILLMLGGATCFGYMIASIAGLVGGLNRTEAIANDRISEITAYLVERSTPTDIMKEIVRYFTHMFEQRTAYDEAAILNRMPKNLRDKILLIQHWDKIERIALFRYISNQTVVLYIFDLMVLMYYEAHRVILREGNYGGSIMFMISGKAKISKAASEKLLKRKRRHYYNERQKAFFSGQKRSQVERAMKEKKEAERKRRGSVVTRVHTYMSGKSSRNKVIAIDDDESNNDGSSEKGTHERRGSEAVNQFFQSGNYAPLASNDTKKIDKETLDERYKNPLDVIYDNKLLPIPKSKCGDRGRNGVLYVDDDIDCGEVHAGCFIGHVAMLSRDARHDATVTSVLPCTFYTLTREAIFRIMNEQPSVALILQIALSKAIFDERDEGGKTAIWEKRKKFLKGVHKSYVTIKGLKQRSRDKKKNENTSHPTSSHGALKRFKMPAFKSGASSELRGKDIEKRTEIAENRWDKIRTLISNTKSQFESTEMHTKLREAIDLEKCREKLGTLTPQSSSGSSSQATMNSMVGAGVPIGGSKAIAPVVGTKITSRGTLLINNYKVGDDTPKDTKDINTKGPRESLLRTISFKDALQKTINQDLTALLQNLLDVTVDDMEYKDTDFKVQNRKLKRVLSLPNVVHGTDMNRPSEISDTVSELKKKSVFKMRRRQTFPAPAEFRGWKLDQKERHVI